MRSGTSPDTSPLGPPSPRYTHSGCDAAEAVIAEHQSFIGKAVQDTVPCEVFCALVLIGGYARGDGGVCYRSGAPAPYNDYDYFVVVRELKAQRREQIAAALRALAHELEAHVGVEVDFALLREDALPRAEFSLMNAEMLWGHKVVAGKSDVLRSMPPMPFAELPLGEFTRLMLNRGSLLLLNQLALIRDELEEQALREQFVKYLFKAALACGDALLAIKSQYHPSYAVKRERLSHLALPDEFLHLYELALRAKFLPQYEEHIGANLSDWYSEVVQTWLRTFRELESVRLRGAIQSWRDYASPLIPKGQVTTRTLAWLRNLAVNWREFGIDEFWRNPAWLQRHPRERLISTLPILLAEPTRPRIGHATGQALRLSADATWLEGSEQFLAMWQRYS